MNKKAKVLFYHVHFIKNIVTYIIWGILVKYILSIGNNIFFIGFKCCPKSAEKNHTH